MWVCVSGSLIYLKRVFPNRQLENDAQYDLFLELTPCNSNFAFTYIQGMLQDVVPWKLVEVIKEDQDLR